MFLNFEKRNRDFLKAVEAEYVATRAEGRPLTAENAVNRVLRSVAPSFYVDVCHAIRVVRARMNGCGSRLMPGSLHEQMWSEIERRVAARRAERPAEPFDEAVIHVLDRGCAPRFYLSPSYALRLVQRLRSS